MPNAAPSALVTVSSIVGGLTAESLHDEDTSTYWQSFDSDPWCQFDWDFPYLISEVRVWNLGDTWPISSVDLLFSDGSTVTMPSVPDDGVSPGIVAFTPRTVRWVKLTLHGEAGVTQAGLREVYIEGGLHYVGDPQPHNLIDIDTTKHFRPFVEFRWGDPVKVRRFVTWDSDIADGGGDLDWLAAPEMEVSCDKQHGGVQDAAYRVRVKRTRQPAVTLCRPFAHATVSVRVYEADPYDLTTRRIRFSGQVATSARNVQGLQNLTELAIVGFKSRLNFALSVICDSTCDHVLGDQGCRVDLTPHIVNGDCMALSGRLISVGSIDSPTPKWWEFGEAYFDGLPLAVVEQTGFDSFRLKKPPPPEWLGSSIRMTPGCDKKIDGDCRNKWANEARFRGLGIKIPAYHPIFESP